MSEFGTGYHEFDRGEHMLCGNATATLWGNATATLWDNATATLRGNATATLRGNATATLRDNATATLWDNATATLWDFAAAHVLSKACKVLAGPAATVICPSYPRSVTKWASIKGIPIRKRALRLWKCVRADGTDFHAGTISYLSDAVAPDWDATASDECGKALHLADSPDGARYFVPGGHRATFRLIEVEALVKDCRCFPGQPQCPHKLRARACKFIREVPRDYRPESRE